MKYNICISSGDSPQSAMGMFRVEKQSRINVLTHANAWLRSWDTPGRDDMVTVEYKERRGAWVEFPDHTKETTDE